LNETLRQALLRARLSEDDIAARLQVGPKTVRRWLEGRVPYPRYRWVLTGLLDADETDLWPEVRPAIAARSRPAEIKAIYPNAMPCPARRGCHWSAQPSRKAASSPKTGCSSPGSPAS
jgi:transcriptional regulator with XRE-family HTH domain